MRALTEPKTAGNGHILQTIYLATSRSIIDYSVVTLVMANATAIQRLEKLQNSALHTILCATTWTKLRTMRQETKIEAVTDRLT